MLLRTRFYIPPRKPEHLVRTALIERLQKSKGGELVLVSAPAGYGKTTLVSQWLHTYCLSFAWLIVDSQQATAQVFWQHVIISLQTLMPKIGQHALVLLMQQGVEAAVISLLNDLDRLDIAQESDHAYTLVMDDFYKAESAAVLSSFNVFLDHLPANLRIVITVRQEPKLALARRRANGQLLVIQQHDLAFSRDECQAFLQHKFNTTITQATAEQLTLATEGWITAIQLTTMSSPSLSHSMTHHNPLNRDTADYLFEEVFNNQPKYIQEFLLHTAHVDKFCPALSNALSNINNSYHLIKEVEAANLFIVALDNHRTWYRYHDLFRQFLLLQQQSLSIKKQHELQQEAASWFEIAGNYESAFHHFKELKNWQKCLSLLEVIAEEKIAQGLSAPLHCLLKSLPNNISSPAITRIRQNLNQAKEGMHCSFIPRKGLIEPLTKRENQVMNLVQQGLSNKDIAERLFISINTLKVHIRNLYGKMGVDNRTQALLKLHNKR